MRDLRYISQPYNDSHACFCIGCCTKCKGCRTHPLHHRVCGKLSKLREEEAAIWARAEVAAKVDRLKNRSSQEPGEEDIGR